MSYELIEKLEEVWDDGNAVGLDGWIGPGRGAGEVDSEAVRCRERATQKASEAILAAGYRKPRTIITATELDALPEGTIVKTEYRFYQVEASRHGIAWWVIFNEQHYFRSADIELPVTVVHEPEARS
ncbi:hypothetical protein HOU49_gp50 [Arthrobacter phage Eileen]|uniref:Uncharacterized protein n=1 Tax=Arthrobacter phage Eileen TaxID=2419956 RepID=A0A3G2KFU1_9CAUD|nr:hypothetical protein HOU49_gp50 [Arthrobacter phage Eileen]AYN57838.1 hypothetical protein PBI_EILEEN_50 [Arthrobacter phage Eileen]